MKDEFKSNIRTMENLLSNLEALFFIGKNKHENEIKKLEEALKETKAGFWGRACSRLQAKSVALEKQNKELREALKDLAEGVVAWEHEGILHRELTKANAILEIPFEAENAVLKHKNTDELINFIDQKIQGP